MRKSFYLAMVLGLVGCSANYSDGFRIGTVRKFSRRGVFIKSWEGEMLLGGMISTGGDKPQLVNAVFNFSVDPECRHNEIVDTVVSQITKAAESGVRSKLYYHQDTWPKLRTNTGYMIYKAEILDGKGQ